MSQIHRALLSSLLRCRSVRSLVLAVTGLALTTLAAAQAQTAPQATSDTGRFTAAPSRVVNLSSLPQASAAELAAHPQPLAPLKGMSAAAFAHLKAQAARGPLDAAAQSPPPLFPKGRETPSAVLVFTSLTESNCNCAPADQALAVGDTPVGVLQGVNTAINVFDKTGVLQTGFPKSLTTFFGISASRPTSDPRAIYDWINKRYIVVMIDFDPNFATASMYHVAVSLADNPTGSYCFYDLAVASVAPAGGIFPLPDYPRLGQDRQAIYLASNIFNPGYKWEEILVVPKPQIYACTPVTATFFANLAIGGVVTDTTQPANIYSFMDDPRSEYMVTSKNIFFANPKNGLGVWSIHSPLSSPVLTGIVIPTANNYSTPPNASQPGGANTIDTNDNRISGSVAYSAGSLYASINAANGAHSEVILYQIQPFVNAAGNISGARLLNEIVHGSSAFDAYYATQQPDPEGNVTYVWNYSGPNNFPSLAFSSRRAGQPNGTEPDGGITAVAGTTFYGSGRWGDYTATAPAGVNTSTPTMWFAGMFAGAGGQWGTAIGKNGYTDISEP